MAASIAKSMERGTEGSVTFGGARQSTEGSRNMMPPTRLQQAHYLMADCVKLRYLLRIFMREGLWRRDADAGGRRPRFLIFVH
jgi:hypothetical protein